MARPTVFATTENYIQRKPQRRTTSAAPSAVLTEALEAELTVHREKVRMKRAADEEHASRQAELEAALKAAQERYNAWKEPEAALRKAREELELFSRALPTLEADVNRQFSAAIPSIIREAEAKIDALAPVIGHKAQVASTRVGALCRQEWSSAAELQAAIAEIMGDVL